MEAIPVVDVSDPASWPTMTSIDFAHGYRVLRSDRPLKATDARGQVQFAEVHRMHLERSAAGYSIVYTSGGVKSAADFPALEVGQPTTKLAHVETSLDEALSMTEEMYYYICDGETDQERSALGLPLHKLSTTQRLLATHGYHKGIHSLYVYISPGESFTGLHREDAGVGSVNLLHTGAAKVWVIIAPYHSARLETMIQRSLQCSCACDQFVRHQNQLVSPSTLKSWNIHFSLVVQSPGDIVETAEGSVYHYVWNTGPNCAEAINKCEDDWLPSPLYRYCGRTTCGSTSPQITARSMEPQTSRQGRDTMTDAEVADDTSESRLSLSEADSPTRKRCRTSYTKTRSGVDTRQDSSTRSRLTPLRSTTENKDSSLRTKTTHLPDSERSSVPPVALQSTVSSSQSVSHDEATSPELAFESSPSTSPRSETSCMLSTEFEKEVARMRAIDPLCRVPANPGRELQVVKLVIAIWSRLAIAQFSNLLTDRRQIRKRRDVTHSSSVDHAVNQALFIKWMEGRTKSNSIVMRLNQCHLVDAISHAVREGMPMRTVLSTICDRCGWNRNLLKYHRRRGAQWKRICGPYKGLLCFLLTGDSFSFNSEDYLALEDQALETFHQLLDEDYTWRLCTAGAAFEQSLSIEQHDVDFRFENEDMALSLLEEDAMVEAIQPFPTGMTDIFEPSLPWHHSTVWPQNVACPENPMLITDVSQIMCDFCSDLFCEREIQFLRTERAQPRIKDYGLRGRGIEAVADIHGGKAYAAGEIIGRLTGVLKPGPARGGCSANIIRPDMPEVGVVCHLSFDEYGSTLRLLNSCADPSARLASMRISRRFGLFVLAVRDIHDGEEISISQTISVGKDVVTH